MKKSDDSKKIADQILKQQILLEGKELEKMLGPETYKDPDGVDPKADFQKLLKARQELKAKNEAYAKATEDAAGFDSETVFLHEGERTTSCTKKDAHNFSNEIAMEFLGENDVAYAKRITNENFANKNSGDAVIKDYRDTVTENFKDILAKDTTNTVGSTSASSSRGVFAMDSLTKKNPRKRFGALAKVAVVVFVAGVCFAGFSLQSEATRMWWMKSLGWNFGDDTVTQMDNDEERDITELPEWEAASIIEKELGIKVPKLQYHPEWLEYSDYMYETIINRAILYYKVGEEYLTIGMSIGTMDTSSSINYDGGVLEEKMIETINGTVFIKEIQNGNSEDTSVIAEWDYLDVHYEILGKISFDEMVKIVENIVL